MTYSVRKADILEEKAAIIKFWNQNQKKTLDEKYTWIYENNPDGDAVAWLLIHDETEEIVGMASLFPRLFCFKEKKYMAGIQGDLFVHPEHRSLGPVITLLKTISQSSEALSYEFLYAFPNKKADLIFRRLGYINIGSIVRRVRLYDSKRFLREKGLPYLISTLGGSILNIVNSLMAPERWYFDYKRHKTEIKNCLDDEYILLWESARNIGFSTCKTLKYMKWKYGADPDEKNKYFTLYKRNNREMIGCIVFCQTGNIIEIRDIIYKDSQYSKVSLVSSFLKYARKNRIESVYYLSVKDALLDRELSSFGFSNRGEGKSIYVSINKKFPTCEEVTRLLKLNNLILLKADQDT